MITRVAKTMVVAGVAFYYSLVVFNNLSDFNSNLVFVRHTLSMDTTFPGNSGMWRAIHSPAIQVEFYLSIIAWEALTAILLWWGSMKLMLALRQPAVAFTAAKSVPVAALTLSLMMWLIAFLAVGGEWFLMWQSAQWNGQSAAFRMFTVVGIALLLLLQSDVEGQP